MNQRPTEKGGPPACAHFKGGPAPVVHPTSPKYGGEVRRPRRANALHVAIENASFNTSPILDETSVAGMRTCSPSLPTYPPFSWWRGTTSMSPLARRVTLTQRCFLMKALILSGRHIRSGGTR